MMDILKEGIVGICQCRTDKMVDLLKEETRERMGVGSLSRNKISVMYEVSKEFDRKFFKLACKERGIET